MDTPDILKNRYYVTSPGFFVITKPVADFDSALFPASGRRGHSGDKGIRYKFIPELSCFFILLMYYNEKSAGICALFLSDTTVPVTLPEVAHRFIIIKDPE
jgi:hypothetical protein